MHKIIVIALSVLVSVACVKRPVVHTPAGPCASHQAAIHTATDNGTADRAIDALIGCIATQTQKPVDLPGAVRGELEANPYPAVRRDADVIWERWFDPARKKQMPESYPEMVTYRDDLIRQAKAREAMGQFDTASAYRKRADKVDELVRIIDAIQAGD